MPLRYKINVLEELKAIGINSTKIRRESLLGQATLQKLRTGNTAISGTSIERLCALLHCQPGDLLEYVEDENADSRDK